MSETYRMSVSEHISALEDSFFAGEKCSLSRIPVHYWKVNQECLGQAEAGGQHGYSAGGLLSRGHSQVDPGENRDEHQGLPPSQLYRFLANNFRLPVSKTLTSQNLYSFCFRHFGWICFRFPTTKSVALGVIGRWLLTFRISKVIGEIWQCKYDEIAALPDFLLHLGYSCYFWIPARWQVDIVSRIVSRLVFQGKCELESIFCGSQKNFKSWLKINRRVWKYKLQLRHHMSWPCPI